MARDATAANNTANQDYQGWEKDALGNYNDSMSAYRSNVNSAIAKGNPYASKDYLTNQNILTSGAMNSANTQGAQQLRDTARRSGTNGAAVAAQIAENTRAGQRDLTNYNAARDTQNQDKWLTYQNQLFKDQLAGAQTDAGVYGSSVSGRGDALNNLTSIQNNEDSMWASMVGAGLGAAGTGLGIAAGGGKV